MTVTAVPLQPVKRSYLVWLWVAIAVLLAGAFLLAMKGDDYWSRSQRGWFGTDSAIKTTASGLQYKILTPGSGPHPTDSDVALINYEGKSRGGATFDKSKRPTPLPVAGSIPGFSEALKLMNKGAKFRIWIPAKLAYGVTPAQPGAPAGDLVFDVELMEFLPQAVLEQYQQQMQGGMGGAPGGPPGGPPGGAPGGPPGGVPGGDGAPPPGM